MLAEKLKKLYPDIDLFNDVELVDNGNGAFIKNWSYSNATKPTKAELVAVDVTQEISNTEVIKARKLLYPSVAEQVAAIVTQFEQLANLNIITLTDEMTQLVTKINQINIDNPVVTKD